MIQETNHYHQKLENFDKNDNGVFALNSNLKHADLIKIFLFC